ncbi:hypothetical protein BW38_03546 [Stenotrophomonas sp. RIT309]|jgi:hypothetical protein|uniref:hypothetical protein n=1 Tax=Stenotrophomonas sp. RIT309 TaxID=1470590 RepID=UPI00044826A4|nr:hypothetical protein [Stenotrophomonas sp. RIT309]EZP43199.1 hypothetical protein BW38_03546 [Stenotrophomonas sp. RIT309]
MYVEVYRYNGMLARIGGFHGWRWRLKTMEGLIVIDARETFPDRRSCLELVSLLIDGFRGPIVDAETNKVLSQAGGQWVDGDEFIPFGPS